MHKYVEPLVIGTWKAPQAMPFVDKQADRSSVRRKSTNRSHWSPIHMLTTSYCCFASKVDPPTVTYIFEKIGICYAWDGSLPKWKSWVNPACKSTTTP